VRFSDQNRSMRAKTPPKVPKVIVRQEAGVMHIILNRPRVINSLDLEMVHLIRRAFEETETASRTKCILLRGNGEKGFCAGGDIKALTVAVEEDTADQALRFFEEEYGLDLFIHRFPKPVIALADGITMGGGLGLAAGADRVVATETTRMAMPETRIGFFPDVGATGWMFTKCPQGYPEFLGLTGYEMVGAECVRLGMATHLIPRRNLSRVVKILEQHADRLSRVKSESCQQLSALIEPFSERDIPRKPAMDAWVRTYFSGKTSLSEMLASLSQCRLEQGLCEGVFKRLSERSPTALVVTLRLLRHNQGRPLDEVFHADLKAARFIISHPDYREGVRARLLDKDDEPRWNPDAVHKVKPIQLSL
jgi:enoyl-CoA hydratase/carnithine racemase